MTTEENTVNIDGEFYKVSELSDEIKNKLALYKRWEEELIEQEEKALKIKLALKMLSNDLIIMIKS